jgi:hypothetical protein
MCYQKDSEISNLSADTMIGTIMERAFEPLAPLAQTTLFWVRELQRIKVTLQNNQNQAPDAVHEGLLEAMQTKLIDYTSFEGQEVILNLYQFMGENFP